MQNGCVSNHLDQLIDSRVYYLLSSHSECRNFLKFYKTRNGPLQVGPVMTEISKLGKRIGICPCEIIRATTIPTARFVKFSPRYRSVAILDCHRSSGMSKYSGLSKKLKRYSAKIVKVFSTLHSLFQDIPDRTTVFVYPGVYNMFSSEIVRKNIEFIGSIANTFFVSKTVASLRNEENASGKGKAPISNNNLDALLPFRESFFRVAKDSKEFKSLCDYISLEKCDPYSRSVFYIVSTVQFHNISFFSTPSDTFCNMFLIGTRRKLLKDSSFCVFLKECVIHGFETAIRVVGDATVKVENCRFSHCGNGIVSRYENKEDQEKLLSLERTSDKRIVVRNSILVGMQYRVIDIEGERGEFDIENSILSLDKLQAVELDQIEKEENEEETIAFGCNRYKDGTVMIFCGGVKEVRIKNCFVESPAGFCRPSIVLENVKRFELLNSAIPRRGILIDGVFEKSLIRRNIFVACRDSTDSPKTHELENKVAKKLGQIVVCGGCRDVRVIENMFCGCISCVAIVANRERLVYKGNLKPIDMSVIARKYSIRDVMYLERHGHDNILIDITGYDEQDLECVEIEDGKGPRPKESIFTSVCISDNDNDVLDAMFDFRNEKQKKEQRKNMRKLARQLRKLSGDDEKSKSQSKAQKKKKEKESKKEFRKMWKKIGTRCCKNEEIDEWSEKMRKDCIATAKFGPNIWKKEEREIMKKRDKLGGKWNRCDYCKRIEKNKRKVCSRCRSRYYCDESCQRKDWKCHKVRCGIIMERKLSNVE